MNTELRERLKRVRILAFDFDGTLTDGFVYFRQDGMETVRCSRRDSLGTNMLQKAGIRVVIISKETNNVVAERAQKMSVDYFHGVDTGDDKRAILERYAAEHDIPMSEVAYMGDDINDLACIGAAGVGITVADGHPGCKKAAAYVTKRSGGDHAVREVCDMLLEARKEGP